MSEKKTSAYLTDAQLLEMRDLEVKRWNVAAHALGYANFWEVDQAGLEIAVDLATGRVAVGKSTKLERAQITSI